MNEQAPSVEQRFAESTPATLGSWSRHDTTWMLGLFGTAIGAGTLFLPINAGLGGFWPLLILAVLAFPMTYFAHRGLRAAAGLPGEPTGGSASAAGA